MSAVMARRPRAGASHIYGLVAIGIAALALFFALSSGSQPCAQAASGTCPVGDTKTVTGDLSVAGGALNMASAANQALRATFDQTAGRTLTLVIDSSNGYSDYARYLLTAEDVAGGTQTGSHTWHTTVNNVAAQKMKLQSGLVVGAPTGGDKGVGTINATAVYDDNTLLTDYVFDLWLNGAIDTAAYDDLVGDRVIPPVFDQDGKLVEPARVLERGHKPAQDLAAKAGWILDVEQVRAFVEANHHLPSLLGRQEYEDGERVSLGAQSQQVTESLELLYVYIFMLLDRIEQLEARPGAPG